MLALNFTFEREVIGATSRCGESSSLRLQSAPYMCPQESGVNVTIRKLYICNDMESKRQKQISQVLKRHFSAVLQLEGRNIYDDALVTVTNVQVAPDLSQAKIYLSIYNTDNKQAVLLKLEEQHHRIKQLFGQRIRKHVRRIPEFAMYIDDTLDEMYKLNALFDKIKESSPEDTDDE